MLQKKYMLVESSNYFISIHKLYIFFISYLFTLTTLMQHQPTEASVVGPAPSSHFLVPVQGVHPG